MIGVSVSVPIACFRKGMAREYLETYDYPPPSTCYGFLLSLVGEIDRKTHIGVRVTFALLRGSDRSTVLRTKWRIKDGKKHPGVGPNRCPDYQQLLSECDLVIWLDSAGETQRIADGLPTLEDRVKIALNPATRGQIERFGGLSLGESTHLVNDVSLFDSQNDSDATTSAVHEDAMGHQYPMLFLSLENDTKDIESSDTAWDENRITLPVWVDHVGATETCYVTGVFQSGTLVPADPSRIPQIVSPV